VGITIYNNSALTVVATTIDWGNVTPGSTKSRTLWFVNDQTAPVNLTYAILNWNPADLFLTITPGWNYTGAILQPKAVMPINITLYILPNATGVTNFSYTFLVTATEVP
jgi:hypothetical protein